MNVIYDIVLNFSRNEEFFEFYEWDKGDSLVYIEKIPIMKITSYQLEEVYQSSIQISKVFLDKIHNKTYSSIGIIPYCLLITDDIRVIALSFNEEGILISKSSLLIDEEEAVIEESREFELESFSYQFLKKKKTSSFYTRKERKIQRYLLCEINQLYVNKNYDEIHYLYQEIASLPRKIEEEYYYLVDVIENHFQSSFESLYNIIKLTQR
jgi:hypothetical protein